MKTLIATIFVLALAACNPATTALPADAGPQITAAIQAQETAQLAALTARNADGASSFYAPDAQLFDPGSPAATTPAAIHNEFATLFADPNGSLTYHGDDVIIPSSSDYAISQGTFTVSYTDPATHHKITASGNYLSVWRHQDDGSWKIIRDISTPGAPAATENHQ